MKKAKNAIFGGALALQAVPLLRSSGRTTTALTGTIGGFIGIGIAGGVADTAFRMVKTPLVLTKKRKRKRRQET